MNAVSLNFHFLTFKIQDLLLCTCKCYAHPPRFVVGGNYEGGLTPAACLFGGTIFYSICTHLCSSKLMKETAPMERNFIIALFKSTITPHFLPTQEGGA